MFPSTFIPKILILQNRIIHSTLISVIHIKIVPERSLINKAALLNNLPGWCITWANANLHLMQIDLLKAIVYDGSGGFRCIAFSLIIYTDTILNLCKMVLTVHQKIRYLSDTFTGFLFYNSPAISISFFIQKTIFILKVLCKGTTNPERERIWE